MTAPTAPTAVSVDKAQLSVLSGDGTVDPKSVFTVQFNPATLRISRANNPDSGKTTQAQKRQHGTPQPATLTFDLEFDTAEIIDGDKLLDVRKLTAEVRKFVAPAGQAGKGKKTDPPPRVQFQWGTLKFPGIVTNLTEELDYFAPDGTPLHAKLNVTITEQNLEFEANRLGPGAANFQVATKPGQSPNGSSPGTRGTGSPTSLVPAHAGESVQQLLTRTGADPAVWRSAMNGLTSPVGLSAGAQVQLDAAVSAGAGFSASAGASVGVGVGLGVSAGFSASAEVSAQAALGGALGVSASAGVSAGLGGSVSAGASAGASVGASVGASAGIGVGAGASAEVSRIASLGGSVGVTAGGSVGASEQMSAGFVLAAGGGISASTNLVTSVRVDASVSSARAAFDVPAATVSPSLGRTPVASPSAAAAVIDSRATTYGISIPLRARATAVTVAGVAAGGPVRVSARAQASEVVVSSAGAPWQRLTADRARDGADAQQRTRDDGPGTMRWTPGR